MSIRGRGCPCLEGHGSQCRLQVIFYEFLMIANFWWIEKGAGRESKIREEAL